MSMKFILSDDITQLEKQLEALMWQLKQDTDDKDIKYHKAMLKAIQEKLEGLK